jgi:5' nucleotidase, deoxy (Pyrimidine), cytosolic type C protein (NT5C)
LRIAIDLDGVVADLSGKLVEIAVRMYGYGPPVEWMNHQATWSLSTEAERLDGLGPRQLKRIWDEVQTTDDFWTTLAPIDAAALPHLRQLATQHQWEVVFLTRRPATAGATVQRQTQRWLVDHGFDLPSVLTVMASRGKVAQALELDVLVDDSLDNCFDVLAESGATPLLICPSDNADIRDRAGMVGIAAARSMRECLDLVAEIDHRTHPQTFVQRLRTRLGLKPTHRERT